MARRKGQRISEEVRALRMSRWREVRDLYNHLRKQWHRDLVYAFFLRQYFYRPASVDHILTSDADDQPVDVQRASHIYHLALLPDFDIRKHV